MSAPDDLARQCRRDYENVGLSLREVAAKHRLSGPSYAKKLIERAGGKTRPHGYVQ